MKRPAAAKPRPPIRLPSVHRCISLGEVVETRMGCGQQKVYECSRFGRCTTTPCKDYGDCMTCRYYDIPLPTRLSRINGADVFPGEAESPPRISNASLMRDRGRWVLALRRQWDNASVWLQVLTDDFQVGRGQPWRLELAGPDAHVGQEDPQLFWHDNQPHIAFVGVVRVNGRIRTNVMYASLDEELRVERVFHPRYAGRAEWEKNWQWFSHGGQLFAGYSISPVHRVLAIDGEQAVLHSEVQHSISWTGGQMRGGASPVLVGDEYWCFFHDSTTIDGVKTYRQGLYTFDAAPPFRPRRYCPEPLIVGNPNTRPPRWSYNNWYVRGAVLHGDRWIFCGGMHDEWVEIHAMNHADLESRLVPIAR